MRNMFRNELDQIGEGLTEISQLVQQAMSQAAQSLFDTDLQVAEEVIEADSEIDRQQVALDEHAIDLIARQAPVASDLRVLVATLRISASLERMGDLARHVAQLVRLRYPEAVIPESVQKTYTEMAQLDVEITALLTQLLDTHDTSIGQKIIKLKERVSELHLSVFTELTKDTWTEGAQQTIDMALLSRYLERISDHAVSISAKVAYLQNGQWRSGPLPGAHDETDRS